MSCCVVSKIYTEEDQYVSNRLPHCDDEFVRSIFCDINRCKNNIRIKKNVNNIEYYYDKDFDEFYLIKFDKHQNLNRKIQIKQYYFYGSLYEKLIKNV